MPAFLAWGACSGDHVKDGAPAGLAQGVQLWEPLSSVSDLVTALETPGLRPGAHLTVLQRALLCVTQLGANQD